MPFSQSQQSLSSSPLASSIRHIFPYWVRRRLVLVVLGITLIAGLLGWGTRGISLYHQDEDGDRFRFLQNSRYRPEKGNTRNCVSASGSNVPCHGNTNNSNEVGSNGYGDGNFTQKPAKKNPWNPRLPNQARVSLYVGLRPDSPSIGHLLAKVVTLSLNDFADFMEFHLPRNFAEQENMNDGPWREYEAKSGGEDGDSNHRDRTGGEREETTNGSNGKSGWDKDSSESNGENKRQWRIVDSKDRGDKDQPERVRENGPTDEAREQNRGDREPRRRHGGDNHQGGAVDSKSRRRSDPHRSLEDLFTENNLPEEFYDMYFSRKKVKLLHKGEFRWWWKYTLVYNCFWAGTYSPVWESVGLGRNITTLLRLHRDEVRLSIARLEGDPRIQITTNGTLVWADGDGSEEDASYEGEDEAISTSGEPDGGIMKASDSSYLHPVDSGVWSWQRYLGLVLLLSVSLSAFCLTQLSAARRRTRIRKQVWSNLASEEGVKHLLQSGWVLKGNQMEIFDKSKLGYRDDSSILIGGFEQKEPVIGSEITCTMPMGDSFRTQDSFRTHQTRRHSSRDFLHPSPESNLSSTPLGLENKSASALDDEMENRKTPSPYDIP